MSGSPTPRTVAGPGGRPTSPVPPTCAPHHFPATTSWASTRGWPGCPAVAASPRSSPWRRRRPGTGRPTSSTPGSGRARSARHRRPGRHAPSVGVHAARQPGRPGQPDRPERRPGSRILAGRWPGQETDRPASSDVKDAATTEKTRFLVLTHRPAEALKEIRRIIGYLSGIERFCDSRLSPLCRMGHLLGYARVSTTDQQPQLQVDALEPAGCYRVFTETASGARTDRPTLAQV